MRKLLIAAVVEISLSQKMLRRYKIHADCRYLPTYTFSSLLLETKSSSRKIGNDEYKVSL